MALSIFDAAKAGEADQVRAFLGSGAELEAVNPYGFTALHCAALACNKADAKGGLEVLRVLLHAGASPNAVSKDGRSVLYLMAEMSWTLEPVQLLVEQGADPNVKDSHGNHVVVNARSREVKQYLSRLTGYPVPPPPLKVKDEKLTAAEWRVAEEKLHQVFEQMNKVGVVALQDAGYTQEDGFSDCSQKFHERGGSDAGLIGICFYTRQDQNRAKRTSLLSLGFWGAPDGNDESMIQVGRKVVEIFTANGFLVDWRGSAGSRPAVYLRHLSRRVGGNAQQEVQPPSSPPGLRPYGETAAEPRR